DPLDRALLPIPRVAAERTRDLGPALQLGEEPDAAVIELAADGRVAQSASWSDLALVPVVEPRCGPAPRPGPGGAYISDRLQDREVVADEMGEHVLRRPVEPRHLALRERPLVAAR